MIHFRHEGQVKSLCRASPERGKRHKVYDRSWRGIVFSRAVCSECSRISFDLLNRSRHRFGRKRAPEQEEFDPVEEERALGRL